MKKINLVLFFLALKLTAYAAPYDPALKNTDLFGIVVDGKAAISSDFSICEYTCVFQNGSVISENTKLSTELPYCKVNTWEKNSITKWPLQVIRGQEVNVTDPNHKLIVRMDLGYNFPYGPHISLECESKAGSNPSLTFGDLQNIFGTYVQFKEWTQEPYSLNPQGTFNESTGKVNKIYFPFEIEASSFALQKGEHITNPEKVRSVI